MRGKNAASLLAVFAATLMMVPMAQAQGQDPTHPIQSTPTSLYFHIFDVFNAFPINTQMPQPEGFFQVGGTNFPSASESTSGTNYDFNTIYGYSTAGPVEYGFIENGQPRFHPERGIAADVAIDPNVQPMLHIYVSPRDFVGTQTAPNILPTYTFRFEMREKNELGSETDLASGKLIMHGEQTLHMASKEFAPLNGTKDANGIPFVVPNADGIIEYAIPMTVDSPSIAKREGYHVKLDWYQNPSGQADQNDRAAEGYMRLVSDDKYHPRLDLAIMNPVYIEFIHPQVAAGILLIHTCLNSPWGTYDVDVANVTVEIKDASGKVLSPNLQEVISQNAHVHNLHDKCAEVTYLWRFRDEGAADGKYSIKVSVQNMAHTATASGTGEFILEGTKAYGIDETGAVVSAAPDPTLEDESSPGVGILVILTLLGAALLSRRGQA